MLNSIEFDSVADEAALFGSGHPGTWNQSRLSGQFPRNCNHSNTNGLTTHSIPHLDENSLNDLYVFGDEESPDTDMQNPQGHVFTDQASGNAHVNMPQPGTSQGTNSSGPKENEDPVVRKKIFKNKENRSKNVNQRNIPSQMQNGFNDAIPVENGPVLQTFEPSWSPKLQFKKYDNDNNEAVRKKSRNGTKQKKQNMNKNSVLVQQTPDSQPCANDSPNENFTRPSQLNYPRIIADNMLRVRRDHVIQPQQTNVDLEHDVFFSVHGLKRPNNDTLPLSGGSNNDDHDDGNRHSGQALVNVSSNFTRLQNNLWDNRSSDKNRNLPRIPVEPFTGSLPQQNLEMDSELPDENTTVLKLPNTLANQGQRQVSNHDLHLSPSIVVPFEHNNSSDNAVQCLQISPNVLTQANSTSASISNIPTSISSNPGSSYAPITMENLPSNLPSSLFFGDGDNDFLLAQQLERKQKDLLSRDFYNSPDLQTNHSYDFETENYCTANEMVSQSDGINDVYDPGQHVALEYQSRGGDGYRGNQETSVCRQPDLITVPHEIQSDEFNSDKHVNYFPDIAGNNDHHVQMGFSQPDTTHRDFSVQEQGSADEEHEFDDETYARMLQEQLYLDTEQQDEQFARILQEREGNAMLFGDREPIHHTRLTRTESEDNENLPLHARYGETMNSDALTRDSSGHRPLRVGPPLNQSHALANNVFDGRIRGQSTWDRPLQRGNEFAFLETVRSLPSVREPASPGYDIPPDYYYGYEIDPDYGDDHLVSISRDPHMLASLLMERAPDMMIPNEVDLNDYEALWELAEGLGEVRRVGMEQEEISLLPVHTYQAPEVADEENSKSDCLVCLNEFESGEKLRTLPCCHIYHVECIDEWLKRNAVCPVCRQSASQQ